MHADARALLTTAADDGTIPLAMLLGFAQALLDAGLDDRGAAQLALALARGDLVRARHLAVDLAAAVLQRGVETDLAMERGA